MASNKRLLKPTKGNSSSPSDLIVNENNSNQPLAAPAVQSADGSVVFACTNFKPCITVEGQLPLENVTPRSRNSQRFANRKRERAVRVRSESRPISALYDIICKEKGFDIATTTTNDEDSSPSHSNDDNYDKSATNHSHRSHRSHSRSITRQPTKSSLASGYNSNMSGGLVNNNLTGGDHPQHRTPLQQKKRNDKYSPNTIFINDLSDDEDDEIDRLEGGCSRKNFRMRHPDKKGNLWDELEQSKSASLPPGLLNSVKLPQTNENPPTNHEDSLSNNISNIENSKISLECYKSSSGSKSNHPLPLAAEQSATLNPLLSSNTITNTTFSVEPIHHSSSSLHDQARTGAGTIATTANTNQSQQQDQLKQPQWKTDRNSRKHRRLRDEKSRRHTDGAIKLFPSVINDLDSDDLSHHNDTNDDDDDGHQQHIERYVNSDDDDDDQHHASSHYHDLNGAGHDFHTLFGSAAAANAKRYITRSQRIAQQQQQTQQEQTNGSRSSPTAASNTTLNVKLQLDLKPSSNSETTTATATTTTTTTTTTLTPVESNGHTIKTNGGYKEPEVEMTNNSGKKSKTTTTVTATTTNFKELKIRIPPTSEATSTTIAATAVTAAAAAAAAAVIPNTSCSNTADKKKDEEKLQQLRYTSPTSPKLQHYTQHHRRTSPSDNCSDNAKLTASVFEAEHNLKMSSTNSSPTHRVNRKLVPSVLVSMKQNLSETQCTATARSNSLRSNANSPKSPKQKLQNNSTEYTVKIVALSKVKGKSDTGSQKASQDTDNADVIDTDFLEINDLPIIPFENNQEGSAAIRPRCSTMYTDSDTSKTSLSNGGLNNETILELSPVHNSRTSNRSPRQNEERDKSSKRKSNLNRSLNEEATLDGDDNAMRRRRRRELGMSRPLVPNDDASVKALISPHKTRVPSPTKPAIRNDLSYHMEMARKGLDLATNSDRRRAQTASPKNQKDSPPPKSSIPISKTSKRYDTVPASEVRRDRSSEINRKLNERTRTGLKEIMKIVENVSDGSDSAIASFNQTINLLRASQENENQTDHLNKPSTSVEEQHRPSPVKHATFVQEERIYYEPDPLEDTETSNSQTEHVKASMLRSLRLLKAKSIERESAAYEPVKLSPILRRKSTEYPQSSSTQGVSISATPNHIVSILKKKDHLPAGESSSASSNASPVTFSSSVMDTPSKQKRAGILKKRSSLDESRYYSRSHSPDERSILIKSARRNSLEEVANGISSAQGSVYHGILKQSSYDSSKSDGCPSATREPQQPQSILKKKDSTSTPSDGGDHAPKHVSISQAVILAAAELSAGVETREKFPNDDIYYTPNNEEYDIKPILKLDSSLGDDSVKPPKPILKKKSSGDSDEQIKPILKTLRKSSREEFEFGPYSDGEGQQEPHVKPILKTDSPSKRRSLGEPDSSNTYRDGELRETLSPFLLKRRTRSLERHDEAPVIDLAAALNAIATSQALPSELVSSLTNSTAGSNISVSERIKSVEKFLANQISVRSSAAENLSTSTTSAATSAVNASLETSIQNDSISTTSAAEGVKIVKPSVIRRDLYKDRFKTQPVTSDERNFFKNNVSTSNNDTLPDSSAFKPAQSLEGLGFAHLSSHGSQSPNSTPSAFTLTRSFTQPLSSSIITPPQSSSSFKVGVPVPLPRKLPVRSSLVHSQDTANSTSSFFADSSILCNSNSERIFEMSSLEQDVDMSENQDPKTPSNKDPSKVPASSAGVVRTNSVKARANMFQQMQEKKGSGAAPNREERTSPKRVPRRLSPSPAVFVEEPKNRNNPPLNPDDEIEPSSLPLSERLRFFSSLSEGRKRNSCYFARSPPFNSIEHCSSSSSYHYYMATTPRSSTTVSSASVTPTPTECALPLFIESPATLRKDSFASALTNDTCTDSIEADNDLTDSRFAIKSDIVKTSPFLQTTRHSLSMPAQVAENEISPITALTPTMKRIKLKTIGKLMLPSPFRNNDRNNNSSKDLSINNETSAATDSNGENENSGPPKKIGKIKSPFIENCNQKQPKQMPTNTTKSLKFDYNNKTQNSLTALVSLENSTEHLAMDVSTNTSGVSNSAVANQRKYQNTFLQTNGHQYNHQQHHHHQHQQQQQYSEDFSTDSGKENVDTSPKVQTTPVIEIRRKFTRKANTSQSFNNSTASGITRQLTPRSVSLNGPHSSPQLDDKYAKYFGVATNSIKSTKTNHQPSLLSKKVTVQDRFAQQQQAEKSNHTPTIAIKRNLRLWHSSARGIKRMGSVIKEVQSFEDISFTDEELMSASKQFDNLLLNDSILLHSPKELENIFSSIV